MARKMSGTAQLARAKQIATHLLDVWPVVLRRYATFKAMNQREDLRDGLNQTYAANVHNALQDLIVVDLIRELGALVLDYDDRAASVKQAVAAVRSKELLQELEKDYRQIPPIHIMDAEKLEPEMVRDIQQQHQKSELARNLEEFRTLQTEVAAAGRKVLKSPVAKKLLTARNKGVAHYEVVQDGSDWRMWRIADTGLTYGDIESFIPLCTEAIDKLNLLVRRAGYMFEDANEIFAKDAGEYLDALTSGLQHEKRDREALLLKRRADLERGE